MSAREFFTTETSPSNEGFSPNDFQGQTFTTTSSYFPTSVTLKIGSIGSYNGSVGIYAVDGSNHPTGSALANLDFSSVDFGNPAANYNFVFTSTSLLSSTTVYAIVLNIAPATTSVFSRVENNDDYSGGNYLTSTDGVNWTTQSGLDMYFQMFGDDAPSTLDRVFYAVNPPHIDKFLITSTSVSNEDTVTVPNLSPSFQHWMELDGSNNLYVCYAPSSGANVVIRKYDEDLALDASWGTAGVVEMTDLDETKPFGFEFYNGFAWVIGWSVSAAKGPYLYKVDATGVVDTQDCAPSVTWEAEYAQEYGGFLYAQSRTTSSDHAIRIDLSDITSFTVSVGAYGSYSPSAQDRLFWIDPDKGGGRGYLYAIDTNFAASTTRRFYIRYADDFSAVTSRSYTVDPTPTLIFGEGGETVFFGVETPSLPSYGGMTEIDPDNTTETGIHTQEKISTIRTVDYLGNGRFVVGTTSSNPDGQVFIVDSNMLVLFHGTYTDTAESCDIIRVGPQAVGIPPSITSQSASQTLAYGSNVTLSVTATGDTPLSYQWKKDGINMSGETASTLSLTSVDGTDHATYTCVVTNVISSVTSADIDISISPKVLTQSNSGTVNLNATLSLSVSAGGSATLTYQWYKNDVLISGATSTTYEVLANSVDFSGTYRCRVTNPYGFDDTADMIMVVRKSAFVVRLLGLNLDQGIE